MVHIDPTPESVEADRLEEQALRALNRAKLWLVRGQWTSAREAAQAAAQALAGLEAIEAEACGRKTR